MHPIYNAHCAPPFSWDSDREEEALMSLAMRKQAAMGLQQIILCRSNEDIKQSQRIKYMEYVVGQMKQRLCHEVTSLKHIKQALKAHRPQLPQPKFTSQLPTKRLKRTPKKEDNSQNQQEIQVLSEAEDQIGEEESLRQIYEEQNDYQNDLYQQ